MSMYYKVYIIFVIFVGTCVAQLCDSGGLTTTCVVSSPKSFSSSQIFTGNNLIITSAISCTPNCSLEFYFAGGTINVTSGSITAQHTTIICMLLFSDGLSTIVSDWGGNFSLTSQHINHYGTIKASYINIKVDDTIFLRGNISADGYGYESSSGPGAGSGGSGGGYGGTGQQGCNSPSNGAGSQYGNATSPTELGSGGGNANAVLQSGGRGGGFIKISAGGHITFYTNSFVTSYGQNGKNGELGLPNGAGGGSGGTIILQAGTITFFGTRNAVNADGGFGGISASGGFHGGGGSGGRIWIHSTNPIIYNFLFRSTVTANGGTGGCNLVAASKGSIYTICPPGYEMMDFACRPCGMGSYIESGKTTCTECPAGTFSNITAASSIDMCTPCSEGTYSSQGSYRCISCPLGQYTNITGSNLCNSCPRGSIANVTGTVNCIPCQAGTYEYGAGTCIICPALTVSNASAATCTRCPPGFVVENNKCIPCPENSYLFSGATRCYDCSSGQYAPSNSTQCFSCPERTFGPDSGLGCFACPRGTTSYSRGSWYCDDCPPGQYNEHEGSFCLNCPVGTFSNTSGSTSCYDCPPNTYSQLGDSRCTACRPGIDYIYGCNDTLPVSVSSTSTASSFSSSASSSSSSSSKSNSKNNSKFTYVGIGIGVFVFASIMVILIYIGRRRRAMKMRKLISYTTPKTNANLGDISMSSSPYSNNQSMNAPPPFNPASYPVQAAVPSAPPPDERPPDNSYGNCIVCYERQKEMAFYPCGHIATCSSCWNTMAKCPLCGSEVTSATKA